MQTTEGMRLRTTRHALRQIAQKGFNPMFVKAAFENPEDIYPSHSHPGQYRITGEGLCLVGVPEGDEFVLITVYLDRVLTPPRLDQLVTEAGRRYAERYEKGLGRG